MHKVAPTHNVVQQPAPSHRTCRTSSSSSSSGLLDAPACCPLPRIYVGHTCPTACVRIHPIVPPAACASALTAHWLIMLCKRTRGSAQIDESQIKFHSLNWELFSEKRPSPDEELVHEFYSNLTSSELMDVFVREIKVRITLNAINELFELPDFEDDEYSSLMSNMSLKIYKKF
ncbi:hypothetical protein PVK06_001470 [Gossypium arboreum]|uniref:Uncharacterized protein n=1 Tax=Gossypium arboreum TaxID=29729 RepID=A0ABR0R1C8_GOSAR|nr:hypothetical protein PVK06_001470 [Gossypium arboreum]